MLRLYPLHHLREKFGSSLIEVRDENVPDRWQDLSFDAFLGLEFEGARLDKRMLLEFDDETEEFAVACTIVARVKKSNEILINQSDSSVKNETAKA